MAHIDPIILATLLVPQIRPNLIPGMARLPFLDVEDPPELFLKQGSLPADLKIDWAARGSDAMPMFIRSARTAVGIGGSTVASQSGRCASTRPGGRSRSSISRRTRWRPA